ESGAGQEGGAGQGSGAGQEGGRHSDLHQEGGQLNGPAARRVTDERRTQGKQTGKITEVVGRVTGDREVEAKGRVEQEAADPAEPEEDVTEAAVEEEKEQVRREHRDIDPSAS